jgi:hypothetical protein
MGGIISHAWAWCSPAPTASMSRSCCAVIEGRGGDRGQEMQKKG